ncbi:hypothetical protein BN2497_11307 [Janthinobacterium sp. CG23_2]|nr:hypothetical protein BN2497_11307 [Janthinobacterium sp. CG23_2]CUU32051.1 hypothetical protein BN3177_11307 [Janthinobacterium sp. CG23_2]
MVEPQFRLNVVTVVCPLGEVDSDRTSFPHGPLKSRQPHIDDARANITSERIM